MKYFIICDIDQTIADNKHRQHHLQKNKDWDSFFKNLEDDKPIQKVINRIIFEHENDKKIIFVTGRPEEYRAKTIKWLEKYFNFSIELLMRKNNDKRNKILVKKEIYEVFLAKLDILYVIDDDDDLLNMWQAIGLQTVDAKKLIRST